MGLHHAQFCIQRHTDIGCTVSSKSWQHCLMYPHSGKQPDRAISYSYLPGRQKDIFIILMTTRDSNKCTLEFVDGDYTLITWVMPPNPLTDMYS